MIRRARNGPPLPGLNYSRQERAREVVKGTSQRVIILRPRCDDMFSEIIFILKSEAAKGVDEAALLRQAREAASISAGRYVRERPRRGIGYALSFLSGAALMAALVWIVSIL